MYQVNLLAGPLKRLTLRSPTRTRALAERLLKTEPERALGLFAAAAEGGDEEAAFNVGEQYLMGRGVVRQPGEAARWYRRAAAAGHLRAQVRLVHLHLLGLRPPAAGTTMGLFESVESAGADYDAALPWARSAAEAGEPEAQALLAYIVSAGPEELRDPAASFDWYRKSAEQDCPQGRLGYALALMSHADTAEKTMAAHGELVRAANAGMVAADFLLGVAAEQGIGTTCDDTAARVHYTIAADAGFVRAQTRIGVLLMEGRGGPRDLLNGESWLRRASLAGDGEAASLLGDLYVRGDENPPNYVEAAHWFRTAAERGHKGASRALGTLYLTGAGVAQDPNEAARWFKQAAEAGDANAQADLAKLLQTGAASDLMQQPPPVHEWFERAAEQGDLVGAFNFAVCLAEGVGVARDDARAVVWMKRAAAGVVDAQYWYGRMLAEGRGVAQNEALAAVWLARASNADVAGAQATLAELHLNSHVVRRDRQLARRLFLRAASKGHSGAMFALGSTCGGERGSEADAAEARRWFARAAARGHPTAALMLARFAVQGSEGSKDIDAGRYWYARAVSLGSIEASGELEALNSALPKDAQATADVE